MRTWDKYPDMRGGRTGSLIWWRKQVLQENWKRNGREKVRRGKGNVRDGAEGGLRFVVKEMRRKRG